MVAHITESRLAGLRHLTVAGDRYDSFKALGRLTAEPIAAVQSRLPEREGLLAWRASPQGRARFDALVDATARTHSTQLKELEALADGAGLPFEDLLLANLRGDIGTDDGTGCTDLAWRGSRAFVAHNEDAAPALDGYMMFLTLRLDGDVPVTALWYPGFVPANAFTLNGHGVGWGINHIQVVNPPVAVGRHFVARGAQQAPTADEVAAYLRAHATAGGFAYTIGDTTTGTVIVAESAAGQVHTTSLTPEQPFEWHTNHLKFLPSSIDGGSLNAAESATRQLGGYEESQARGAALATAGPPAAEPDVEWFIDTLSGRPLPHGVHRTATGTDPLMTLCSVVLDLDRAELTARGHSGAQESVPLAQLH